MKITLFSTLFVFVLLPILSPAQRIAFSASEQAFFEAQKAKYQRWLDKTGTGRYLKTHGLRLVNHNTELELFLVFKTLDPDTAAGQWVQLNRDFDQNLGASLSEELFDKFTHFMDLPAEQGNIQIHVLTPTGEIGPCLYIWLWEENGAVQQEEKLNNCRAKSFDVTVPAVKVKQLVKGKTTYVAQHLRAEEVFDSIKAYAKKRYLRIEAPDRRPEILDWKNTSSRLKFTVEDLCKEVLADEEKSLWCTLVEVLGGKCNDVTRERLEFEFEYDPDTGKLHCDLTGKFGSGVYRPRQSSGWMSMEPDFETYLERYANKIGQDLEVYLKKL